MKYERMPQLQLLPSFLLKFILFYPYLDEVKGNVTSWHGRSPRPSEIFAVMVHILNFWCFLLSI